MVYLYLYAAITILIALHFAWYLLFKFDRYDWQFKKGNIWIDFVLFTVLWPLLLIRPQNLFDPGNIFKDSFGLAQRRREQDHLLENPPPCGAIIRYRPQRGGYEETYGEFLFSAADVEQSLHDRLNQHPHLSNDDEGAILNWLQHRNETLKNPSDVPSVWDRFQYIASDLISAGRFEAHCLQCEIDISGDELIAKNDCGLSGWIVDRLTCPSGHVLLAVKTMHLNFA